MLHCRCESQNFFIHLPSVQWPIAATDVTCCRLHQCSFCSTLHRQATSYTIWSVLQTGQRMYT